MRRRLSSLIRGGHPWVALGFTLALLSAFALQRLVLFHRLDGAATNPWILGTGIPLLFVGLWAATAKVARDVAQVQRENAEREARADLADRQFLANDPALACSDEEFAGIVEQELDALPAWIRTAIGDGNVAIGIDDERPGEPRVLGLFSRLAGTQQITLYRTPLLRIARDRDHLHRAIHGTLLHELGHLFGMSEEDLDHYTIGNRPLPGAQPVHPPATGPRLER